MKNITKNNGVHTDTLNKIFPAISPEILALEEEVKLPKILEENVRDFCSVCGKLTFSNLLEIDGKVYLERNCCKKELVFLENDVEFFCKHRKNTKAVPFIPNANNWEELMNKKPNYTTNSVMLYITTKCNMNCPICYFRRGNISPNSKVEMSVEEVKERMKRYRSQKIVIMGGEPTAHKDIFEIIKAIKGSGNIPIMATNGLKLKDKNYLEKLKEAGLDGIYLQFDGFNKEANIRFRGRNYTEIKLKTLKNIKEVGGFREVHLTSVIEKGANEAEMHNIIQLALKNKSVNQVTFFGLMPPANEKEDAETTFSDMIKVMEKDGYFDREYFFELVKMFQNIYETTRKIFDGTSLENWAGKQLQENIEAVPFKKKGASLQLLFQRNEIKENRSSTK